MNENEIQILLDEYQDGVISYENALKLANAIKQKNHFSKLIMSELAIRGSVSQALSYTNPDTFLKSFWERYHAEKTDDDFLKKFESKNANAIQEKLHELKTSDSNRREKSWNINITDNATSKQRGKNLWKPESIKQFKMIALVLIVFVIAIFALTKLFAEKPIGELVYVSRGFQILHNGELKDGYGQKLFYRNDQIMTSLNATVDLKYKEGASVLLLENSHLTIEVNERLNNKILSNALHRIDIDRGSLKFKISVTSGPFLLSTPQGKFLIRDAEGHVMVNSNATMMETSRNECSFYQTETSNPINVSENSSFIINSEGQIENRKLKILDKGDSNE